MVNYQSVYISLKQFFIALESIQFVHFHYTSLLLGLPSTVLPHLPPSWLHNTPSLNYTAATSCPCVFPF